MKKLFSVKRIFSLFLLLSIAMTSFAQPKGKEIEKAINEAYEKFKSNDEGANADYIPYLEKIDSKLFGIAIVTAGGNVYKIGDTAFEFGIESISKVFTLAIVMQEQGSNAILEKIGVEQSGLPFNSVLAIEQNESRTVNPFVNAGAIATNSMLTAKTEDEKWGNILSTYSKFAGRDLHLIKELYTSEAETNQHNQAIAKLLESYGRIYSEPIKANDSYTKECSVAVSAEDLATMTSVFANHGVNPITKEKCLEDQYIPRILAVMATTGLYDTSGEWLYKTGLPAKSGVGGGIIAVVPGQMGIAVFSPKLDKAGNSIKAQKAIEYIVNTLHLNPYDVK